MTRYACPCCGFLTMNEPPPGTFDICPVCCWEDDETQYRDPDSGDGANQVSLHQARINFNAFGAATSAASEHVRTPLPHEIPSNHPPAPAGTD